MMNILQTIWTAMTTQSETLVKIQGIPLTFLDIFVCMLYFSTILNIQSTRKMKLIYVLIYGTIANFITFIIPAPYAVFVNLLVWPAMVFFILKTSFLKSILSEIITMVTTAILDFVFANMFFSFLHITTEVAITIPIYRLLTSLSIYLILFILSRLIKLFKLNIEVFDNMNNKTKILLIVNSLLIVLVIGMQFYLITFYSSTMPLFITIISVVSLIAYFTVSIYSIVNSSKLETTQLNLDNANKNLHSLQILHDELRTVKHDFNNMVNCIGGYVLTEDIPGLKRYYQELLEECNKTNNLYALSPQVINHPAIYHMLATKYYEADQMDVQIFLNVFLDLNEIEKHMRILDFTRILGILLDNAIDAAKECDKKEVNVTFRKDIDNRVILVIIQNTYNNKEVDTESIFLKGNTSKENHSGLGLWKVRQILSKNNNLNLYTTKNDEYFTQQFEIYI